MKLSEIKNIAVIGAGLMGHGFAQIFASRGYSVILQDLSNEILDKAVQNIRSNLETMAQYGRADKAEINGIIQRIILTEDMKEAAAAADFVIEAAPEKMDLKQNIFRELDSVCRPEVILATNTSVMSISEIASLTRRPDRVVGTHFWNPPFLIPLVEVIKGMHTTDKVMDLTFDLMKKVGKHPVRVKKDAPGFVGNRLQHALWREAISIVEHGIADAAEVDEVIKNSFGIRLPVLGPMENADMVGLDLTFQVHDYILKHLEASPEPSALLKQKLENGELGFKSGRGFMEWTPEQAKASRERLLHHLLNNLG